MSVVKDQNCLNVDMDDMLPTYIWRLSKLPMKFFGSRDLKENMTRNQIIGGNQIMGAFIFRKSVKKNILD